MGLLSAWPKVILIAYNLKGTCGNVLGHLVRTYSITTLRHPQVQALGAEVEDSKQRQHRAEQEHQFALAALQAQLKHAAGEMEVLRAGAGHTKDQALSALKVRPSLP